MTGNEQEEDRHKILVEVVKILVKYKILPPEVFQIFNKGFDDVKDTLH